jgi:flagellar hook protein FlgE
MYREVGLMQEMSNVDLAKEFSNLIIAERGFQANSRVITTTDEILAELMNIVR